MIWGNFEKDRAEIASLYDVRKWDETSGVTPEALLDECLSIEKEYADNRMLAKTKMLETVLHKAQLDVREGDFFPERLRHDYIITRIRDRWIRSLRHEKKSLNDVIEKYDAEVEGLAFTGSLDLGHCSPDWDAVMTLGLPGLLARAKAAKENGEKTAEQDLFYNCVITTLESAIHLVGRFADATAKLGGEKMLFISDSLRSLTVGAPRDLLAAMQLSMIFYNLQTHVEGEAIRSVGGLDRLFYPFYKRDIESGKLTKEQARELFRYYFHKFHSMHITANIPFFLGGRLPDGSSGINELSYLIVEEYTALDIHDPKIHIRWYDEMPDEFLQLVLRSIRMGRSSFVFVNDNVIEKALIGIGDSPEDARNYTVIGCYEPCALGKEMPWTCAGRINMSKALLTVLYAGVDPYLDRPIGSVRADPDSYKTFDEFYTAVKAQIKSLIDATMEKICAVEDYCPYVSQAPLLSSTFASAIERGRDVYDGGAVYSNSSIVVFSVASTVDALTAVKKLVYDQKRMTLSELAEILKNNWEGHELLLREVRQAFPKYGNGIAEVDAYGKDIVDYVASEINGKPNHRGGVFRLGLFSIDYRIAFGERMTASPDGRKHGEMLSKNMCAVTAMDKEGVTALIRSATSVDYTKVPDGTVLDIMLHSSAAEGESGLMAMSALVKTNMQRGGFAIQMNVLSPDVLRAAQKEPEKYKTLQVRLCGWNVYFVELTEAEQNDLIRQCENAEG